MKTTVALVIALLTLLPHAANATTLTITSGSIVLNWQVQSGGGGVGSLMLFGGDDFSVQQGREPGFFGDFSPAFGVEPFVQSIQFYTGFFSGIADVRVGTEHCFGSDFVSCGDIRLTSPGFAMPADWPNSIPFVASVPFTATGQLLVGAISTTWSVTARLWEPGVLLPAAPSRTHVQPLATTSRLASPRRSY